MTIDEAIRVLKIMVEDCDRLNEPHSKDCLQLGIEALEHLRDIRHAIYSDLSSLLPGETEK